MAIKLTAHILNCSKGDSMEKESYAPQPTASKDPKCILIQPTRYHVLTLRDAQVRWAFWNMGSQPRAYPDFPVFGSHYPRKRRIPRERLVELENKTQTPPNSNPLTINDLTRNEVLVVMVEVNDSRIHNGLGMSVLNMLTSDPINLNPEG